MLEAPARNSLITCGNTPVLSGAIRCMRWSLIEQLSYVAALVIWLVALWSYCANPVPEATIGPDGDYEALAARTRNMVGAANTELVKVNRP